MKTEILFGIHPVLEGLRAGRRKFSALYLAQTRSGERSETLEAAAESRGVPVRRISPEKLRALAGSEFHQGVAAEAGPYPVVPMTDLTDASDPFLLIIDSVVDPHNLGALIRTALCVGASGVILPKDRAAAPTPVVSKASAGALEHIRLSLATNLARTLEDLKKKGHMDFRDGRCRRSLHFRERSDRPHRHRHRRRGEGHPPPGQTAVRLSHHDSAERPRQFPECFGCRRGGDVRGVPAASHRRRMIRSPKKNN